MTQTVAVPRVLLVDDEPLVLRIAAAFLDGEFEVLTACTGDEGLSLLAADPSIAVVLSDLHMPGILSGQAFLGEARRLAPFAVRIALTADDSTRSVLDAVNRGHVFRYLLKPLSRDLLRTAVRDAVEQRRLLTADRDLMRATLERVTGQMLQAERLATLGGLANGVGHELNNVAASLTFVLGDLEAAQAAGVSPDCETVAHLGRVAEHVTAHARYLLHLGKPRGDAVEALDLVRVAHDVVTMLGKLGRTRAVRLTCEAPDAPLLVMANRTRVEQVITNLVVNAADAAGDVVGHDVAVTVRLSRCDDAIQLQVADTAGGIRPEHLPKIFDPYFTTKPAETGTGLGLAVVRQIVEAFGGQLNVESALGVGTTFTIAWPAVAERGADVRLAADVAA